MSETTEKLGKNQLRKAKRRALDAANPYRKEVRRKIRSGELPRYKIERVKILIPIVREIMDYKTGKTERRVVGHKRRTELKFIDTFQLLTKNDCAEEKKADETKSS